jgi:hypothetical protein
MRSGAIAGVAFGAAIAVVVACGGTQKPVGADPRDNEITALWTQIRDWRREARMDLEPTPQSVFAVRNARAPEVAKVCPLGHPVPATCSDVCNFADAICDNAETICNLADELGKGDEYAQDKCASAKASCREGKQRCCDCSAAGPT